VIDVADWGRRYGSRVDSWRLPSSQVKRAELMAAYGGDAMALLRAIYDPQAPGWLSELPAAEVLRVMLVQNYVITTDTTGREVIRARKADSDGLPPCRARLSSPYDLDARYAVKGADLRWTGYKEHLTETCDAPGPSGDDPGSHDPGSDPGGDPGGEGRRGGGRPNLIVGVETTDATVPDVAMTEPIHTRLAERALLPDKHLVDSGYPSAQLLVDSQRQWGIELVSPLQADKSRQAKAGQGYDRSGFTIDFDAQHAICPQGQTSTRWEPATPRGTPKILIRFAARTCGDCPVREQCTRSTSPRFGRQLTIPTREAYHAQLAARASQDTPHGRAQYALRAGVEGTIRQAVAVTGIRRARYRGLPKTRLQHIYSAVAVNLIRLHAYWHGHAPDRGRTSHLTRLEHALAA
jgi:hypothetical protein